MTTSSIREILRMSRFTYTIAGPSGQVSEGREEEEGAYMDKDTKTKERKRSRTVQVSYTGTGHTKKTIRKERTHRE